MVENNGHDVKQVIKDLHKMMVTVACSGPDGISSVVYGARNMIFYSRVIARQNRGRMSMLESLKPEELTSPQSAIGYADLVRDELNNMLNERPDLSTEVMSIAALTGNIRPMFERFIDRAVRS